MYEGCWGCHCLGFLVLYGWLLCWWKVWGAMGVAGTLEVVEVVEDLGENLGGTFGCLLKLTFS